MNSGSQDYQASEMQQLTSRMYTLAQNQKEDALVLLSLLREIEKLHQEIRDDFFQAALPNNRQGLYALLRDIEAQGGWPYIARLKLQVLLDQIQAENPLPEVD